MRARERISARWHTLIEHRMYTRPMPTPAPSTKANAVNVNEHTWKRRAFHLCAALVIPVVALGFGYKAAVYTAAIAAAALASGEALRLAVPAVNVRAVALLGPLLKPREKRSPTAATYLALASLTVLLLFGIPAATLALALHRSRRPGGGHCRHAIRQAASAPSWPPAGRQKRRRHAGVPRSINGGRGGSLGGRHVRHALARARGRRRGRARRVPARSPGRQRNGPPRERRDHVAAVGWVDCGDHCCHNR